MMQQAIGNELNGPKLWLMRESRLMPFAENDLRRNDSEINWQRIE
jgi:hypothetical protein